MLIALDFFEVNPDTKFNGFFQVLLLEISINKKFNYFKHIFEAMWEYMKLNFESEIKSKLLYPETVTLKFADAEKLVKAYTRLAVKVPFGVSTTNYYSIFTVFTDVGGFANILLAAISFVPGYLIYKAYTKDVAKTLASKNDCEMSVEMVQRKFEQRMS